MQKHGKDAEHANKNEHVPACGLDVSRCAVTGPLSSLTLQEALNSFLGCLMVMPISVRTLTKVSSKGFLDEAVVLPHESTRQHLFAPHPTDLVLQIPARARPLQQESYEASASRLGRSKRISARSIHDGPMAVDNLLAEGVQEAEPKQKANKDWQLEPPSSGIPSSSSCELSDC